MVFENWIKLRAPGPLIAVQRFCVLVDKTGGFTVVVHANPKFNVYPVFANSQEGRALWGLHQLTSKIQGLHPNHFYR